MKRLVVFISGKGSNLQALHAACLSGHIDGYIVEVISNKPDAFGIEWAKTQSISTRVIDHRLFASRLHFEESILNILEQVYADFILLAGFMRVLTTDFINHYVHRIINIHPSLLPAYTGLHTHARVLADGAKVTGATVHFVTPTLDQGPIIMQGATPVLSTDTEQSLAERVLKLEHAIYVQSIQWLCQERLSVTNNWVHVKKSPADKHPPLQLIFQPA